MRTKEFRVVLHPMEVREDGGVRKLIGYATRYNEVYDAGGFREKIAPGALVRAVMNSDVRALFNHDPNHVLGRTNSGTLILTDDEIGLRYEVDPPDTQWARDLLKSIERGDINQSSFAFTVAKDGDRWDDTVDPPLRTILDISTLYDVSPVTYPASPTTSVGVRSAQEVYQAHKDACARAGAGPSGEGDIARARLSICRKRLDLAEKAA